MLAINYISKIVQICQDKVSDTQNTDLYLLLNYYNIQHKSAWNVFKWQKRRGKRCSSFVLVCSVDWSWLSHADPDCTCLGSPGCFAELHHSATWSHLKAYRPSTGIQLETVTVKVIKVNKSKTSSMLHYSWHSFFFCWPHNIISVPVISTATQLPQIPTTPWSPRLGPFVKKRYVISRTLRSNVQDCMAW